MACMKLFRTAATIVVAFLITVGAPARAELAPEWTIDPDHSNISFSVRHILSQVTGTFDHFTSSLRFDPNNLAGSRVMVEIPVAGINTRNAKRDSHLQTPDFFDAATYPSIRFVGDTFVRIGGENRYSVIGRLTIRGVTRRVVLPFEFQGVVDHPMKPDNVVTGTRIELELLRSDYGVGTGSYAETVMIGDEVAIKIDIEAFRPKATASPATQHAKTPSSRPAW